MRSLPASRALASEPKRNEIVEGDRLGSDESALEIAMDDPRRRRRLVAGLDRPRPRFLGTGRKVRSQSEKVIHRANQLAHSAVCDAEIGKKFARLFSRQFGELALDLCADDNRLDKRGTSGGSGILCGGKFPDRLNIRTVGRASSFSATLQAKMAGLEVRRKKPRTVLSSSESLAVSAGLPESRWGRIFSQAPVRPWRAYRRSGRLSAPVRRAF